MLRESLMGYRPRIRKKTNRAKFLLFSSDTSLGWIVIRVVTFNLGERNVSKRIWQRVNDASGAPIGYQILCSLNADLHTASNASPSAITASENILFAGQSFSHGKSRTAGMSEDRKVTRQHPVTGRVLPPEDAVECVVAKVKSWPYPASKVSREPNAPYGDRAVRVYPKA